MQILKKNGPQNTVAMVVSITTIDAFKMFSDKFSQKSLSLAVIAWMVLKLFIFFFSEGASKALPV